MLLKKALDGTLTQKNMILHGLLFHICTNLFYCGAWATNNNVQVSHPLITWTWITKFWNLQLFARIMNVCKLQFQFFNFFFRALELNTFKNILKTYIELASSFFRFRVFIGNQKLSKLIFTCINWFCISRIYD